MRRVALLLALIAALVLPHSAPAEAASLRRLTAMTFNTCGSVCNGGNMKVADYTASRIRKFNPDVVFLQEICYSQYRRMKSTLGGRGYSFAFAKSQYAPKCNNYDHKHGTAFGVAVVYRGTLLKREVKYLTLMRGFTHPRVALGITARVQGRKVFLAAVHNGMNAAEGNAIHLIQMKQWMDSKRKTMPVMAGGDWNAWPTAAGIQEISKTYRDLDYRDSQGTFDRGMTKIDYIFVSSHFTSLSGVTLTSYISDHRLYLGRAYW